jgi:signal transduction histidine kinase
LTESLLNFEQRELVEMIRTSGEMLMSLINNLLDLSKIEANKIVLEEVEFSVRDTMEQVADVVAFRAESKGVGLYVVVERDVPNFLLGDHQRLKQVQFFFVLQKKNHSIPHIFSDFAKFGV